MQKKTLCLLLALLTVGSTAMAACSEKQDDDAAVTTDAVSTIANEEELDSLEARKLVDDNVETVDFEGKTFDIITETDKVADTHLTAEDVEGKGDVLEDAIYERNSKIAERFNITFEVHHNSDYEVVTNNITKTVTAQDDAYDLISYHVVRAGGLATGNYLYNWYDIPVVNFDRPWWNKSNQDVLTHADVCKLAIGEFALSAFKTTYCMYFNQELAANYNYGNLYDVVNNGEWTKDYMYTLTKDTFGDNNGNSKKDDGDLYGFAQTNGSAVNTYLWAFDNPIFIKNNEGELEYVYKTPKVGEIISWLDDFLFDQPGVYCTRDSNNAPLFGDMYRNDQVIITTGIFNTAIAWRDLEVDFGIIPYPKWDENQEFYQTMSDGNHAALAIPYSVQDTEFAGTITEVLCAETWKNVQPVYYDVALKVKGARDEESIAILDMIFENRVFDFGYVYDNWKGVSFFLQWMLRDNNTNFESYYKKQEKPVTRYYEKVLTAFEDSAN